MCKESASSPGWRQAFLSQSLVSILTEEPAEAAEAGAQGLSPGVKRADKGIALAQPVKGNLDFLRALSYLVLRLLGLLLSFFLFWFRTEKLKEVFVYYSLSCF